MQTKNEKLLQLYFDVPPLHLNDPKNRDEAYRLKFCRVGRVGHSVVRVRPHCHRRTVTLGVGMPSEGSDRDQRNWNPDVWDFEGDCEKGAP